MERALDLEPELRAMLARLWEARGAPPPIAPFTPAEVRQAERALGSFVPDAILAFLAATYRRPAALVGLTQQTIELGETTFERELPEVAVADVYGDWPAFAAVFGPTCDRTSTEVRVLDMKKWVFAKPEPLASWLRWRFSGEDAVDFDVAPSAESLAAFTPSIAPPRSEDARKVRHAKLGVGRVVRELGDRLELDFGEGGVRTLLARFVEPVDR